MGVYSYVLPHFLLCTFLFAFMTQMGVRRSKGWMLNKQILQKLGHISSKVSAHILKLQNVCHWSRGRYTLYCILLWLKDHRHLITTCAPLYYHFRTLLPTISTIGLCSENVATISLTVQELSCWQTDRDTDWDKQTMSQTDTTENNSTLAARVVNAVFRPALFRRRQTGVVGWNRDPSAEWQRQRQSGRETSLIGEKH